ncbi:MAG TPA: universal stress protein [Acidimicrobiia bacterium]|jgi:nucleotide-binding universal stress UspA family protein
MISTIVVGVNEEDSDATRWAGERAAELGAQVVAVFVVRPITEFLLTIPPLPSQMAPRMAEMLERDWCKPLRSTGVRYRSYVVENDPANGLVAAAEQENADMLVLGARSRGGIADRLLGSVTYKVAHRAHCPVVIVR